MTKKILPLLLTALSLLGGMTVLLLTSQKKGEVPTIMQEEPVEEPSKAVTLPSTSLTPPPPASNSEALTISVESLDSSFLIPRPLLGVVGFLAGAVTAYMVLSKRHHQQMNAVESASILAREAVQGLGVASQKQVATPKEVAARGIQITPSKLPKLLLEEQEVVTAHTLPASPSVSLSDSGSGIVVAVEEQAFMLKEVAEKATQATVTASPRATAPTLEVDTWVTVSVLPMAVEEEPTAPILEIDACVTQTIVVATPKEVAARGTQADAPALTLEEDTAPTLLASPSVSRPSHRRIRSLPLLEVGLGSRRAVPPSPSPLGASPLSPKYDDGYTDAEVQNLVIGAFCFGRFYPSQSLPSYESALKAWKSLVLAKERDTEDYLFFLLSAGDDKVPSSDTEIDFCKEQVDRFADFLLEKARQYILKVAHERHSRVVSSDTDASSSTIDKGDFADRKEEVSPLFQLEHEEALQEEKKPVLKAEDVDQILHRTISSLGMIRFGDSEQGFVLSEGEDATEGGAGEHLDMHKKALEENIVKSLHY